MSELGIWSGSRITCLGSRVDGDSGLSLRGFRDALYI